MSFPKPLVFLILVGTMALLVHSAAAQSRDENTMTPGKQVASTEVEIRKIRPGVWVHTSYYIYPGGARYPSNGLIVREEGGVLLVDMAWGERLTRLLLDRIEADIGLPVRYAVVTHSHNDRLAGADVLEARGIKVYALPLTQRLAIGQGMPVPNDRLEGLDTPGASIRLGPVEILYPGPGHAPDNLMVWVPSERVLFGGCAIREVNAETLGGIADAEIAAWPEAIRRVRARYRDVEVVVPGHGKAGGPDLLDHTLSLLERKATREN